MTDSHCAVWNRVHRRYTQALRWRCVSTVLLCWCDSWHTVCRPACWQSETERRNHLCNNLSFDEYNTNEYSHPEKCVTVCVSGSYQSLLGSDQWSVLAVHLVVQSTGVTQVVACAIPAPQRGSGGSTVNTLSGLCLEWENTHLSLTMYHFVNRYKIVSVHLTWNELGNIGNSFCLYKNASWYGDYGKSLHLINEQSYLFDKTIKHIAHIFSILIFLSGWISCHCSKSKFFFCFY